MFLCSFVVHSILKYLATVLAENVDKLHLLSCLWHLRMGLIAIFNQSAHSLMLSLLCTDLLIPLMLAIIAQLPSHLILHQAMLNSYTEELQPGCWLSS